jgi:gliding motility-associated-like protein
MMIKTLLLFIITTLGLHTFAQKAGNIWYFGNNLGLDFNAGPPAILTNGQLSTSEGCASISDPALGTLLLYTDGIKVWDKNHTQMPATLTTPLLGDPSSTQSGVIVPQPGNPNIYYIFTTPSTGGNFGPTTAMCYSTVDLTLNGGNGDVINPNVVVMDSSTEKIAVIGNCGGTEFWVVGHQWNSDSFYAFRITASGVGVPVKSKVGIVHTDIGSGLNGEAIGYMKFSPDGTKLGLSTWVNLNTVEIFDFNFATGAISNPITDAYGFNSVDPFDGPYGCSFSPDNSKFYVGYFSGTLAKVFQYNMNAGSAAAILSSKTLVASDPAGAYGALQNGPDGKMYLTKSGATSLDVFNSPNSLGLASGHTLNAITFTNGSTTFGLPAMVENFLAPGGTPVKMKYNSCLGLDSLLFASTYDPATSTLLWDFGDPGSGAANSSTLAYPTHNYTNNGSYTVTVIVTGGCNAIDTVTGVVTIGSLNLKLSNDTAICTNNQAQLNVSSNSTAAGIAYSWLPATSLSCSTCTNPIASPSTTTTYTVTGSIGTCSGVKTVKVTVDQGPNMQILTKDSTYCRPGSAIQVQTTVGNFTSVWSPNTNISCTNCFSPVVTPNISTNYVVTATTANGCKQKDTLRLTVVDLITNLVAIKDSSCVLEPISLNAQITGANPKWFWIKGDGSGIGFNNISNFNPSYPIAGIYTVTLIAYDTLGCRDTLTQIVSIDGQNYATYIPSDTQICEGQPVFFTDSISPFSTSWVYNFGEGPLVLNTHNPVHYYETPLSNYTVTLTAKSPHCTDYVYTKQIEVVAYPKLNLGPDTSFCSGLTSAITLSNKAAAPGSFLWSDASTNNSLLAGQAGTYFATLTHKGCSTADTIIINRDCYINIPNAFSPNKDGINNYFFPTDLLSAGLNSFSMRIYNRWGNLVFETNRIDSRGWDGQFGGANQPIGVYVYQIDCTFKTNERKSFTGNVTLIR